MCPVNVSYMRSLEFTVKRIMIKLFRTYDNGIINSCMSFFGLPTVSELVSQRKNRFQLKCNLLDNLLCNVSASRRLTVMYCVCIVYTLLTFVACVCMSVCVSLMCVCNA